MQVTEDGLKLIRDSEGYVDHVYNDRGKPAIGYGHQLLPGETFDGKITKEQANILLALDVAKAVRCINLWVKVSLNQNQYDSLSSLIFNIGAGRFRDHILPSLNAGDYQGAADAFLQFNADANGLFLVGKAKRRAKERDLFLRPIEVEDERNDI